MKIGDVVQNIHSGNYGTVHYSTFGVSIHSWNKGRMAKTLGYPVKEVAEHWKVVPLPEGYKIHEYGGIINE